MHHPTGLARWILALFAVAGLCSCKSEVYERLDERDANEMLATLYSAGIQASKITADEKTWSVTVQDQDLPTALRVVAAHGLPREQFANVGDLFKKEGLVSTPSEERIRYIYAVSQELSDTLSQIDGVIVARVHPVIPANDPLASQIRPASASVFIKYRRDADLEALAPPIKNLIMRSIEGLQYENISLTFVPADDLSRSAKTSTSGPGLEGRTRVLSASMGVGGLVLTLLIGVGLGGWVRHGRRTISRATTPAEGSGGGAWTPKVR
jgi:type III secretion protein J